MELLIRIQTDWNLKLYQEILKNWKYFDSNLDRLEFKVAENKNF